MSWYPNAIAMPIGKHRTTMAAHRRFVLHTAVSSASSLYPYFSRSDVGVCSHFYLRADGTIEQYVDTRYRAPAQVEGNPDCISLESQDMGGPFPSWSGSNVPPWTDAQVSAIVDLCRWVNQTHGIPIDMLPSSHSGTRGIGWHRIGVDGNFPTGLLGGRQQRGGGQHWSTSTGKVCPGDSRIRQIPTIITRAQEDDMPTVEEIWAHEITNLKKNPPAPVSAASMLQWAHEHATDAEYNAADAKTSAAKAVMELQAVKTELAEMHEKLDQVAAGNVDYATLARAVADELAERLGEQEEGTPS